MTPRPGPPVPTGLDAPPAGTVCLTDDVLTTEDAAHRVGVGTDSFRTWAKRRGLRPTMHVRIGRSSHAVWSLVEVLDAETRGARVGGDG
jgi:hypothetical protein